MDSRELFPYLVPAKLYGVHDPAGWSCEVVVWHDGAYCTCGDYWKGTSRQKRQPRYPQRFFGATVPHGCQHIDDVLDKWGYVASAAMTAPRVVLEEQLGRELRDWSSTLDALEVAFRQGVELGRRLAT
jgi:hypothetical protein